jgi:ABC-type uncharacterized transport system involved in gliding motility auxiliary subunit
MSAPKRAAIGTSVSLTVVFAVMLFGIVNYLSMRHHRTWDVSGSGMNTLSDKTLNVIRSLPKPVTLVFLFNRDNPLYDRTRSMLERYQDESQGKVRLQVVDLRDPATIDRVVRQYKIATGTNPETGESVTEDVIVVDYDGRSKVLSDSGLAEMSMPNPMTGEMQSRLRRYLGEEKVTSAIASLQQGKAAKVYFLAGRGEGDVASSQRRGYLELSERLKRDNFEVAKLNLLESGEVPKDAGALVVMGPTQPYTTNELGVLRRYLAEGNGRMFVALEPGVTSGLEPLLAEHGIRPRNDLAVVNVAMLGVLPVIPVKSYGRHAIVDRIESAGVSVTVPSSVSLDTGSGGPGGPVSLLVSPESAWGETDLDAERLEFDEKKDHKGPLVLAAVADTTRRGPAGDAAAGSKLVVAGSASMFANQNLVTAAGALDFALNTLNWLLQRETQLGIAPKVPEEHVLQLSPAQARTHLVSLVAVPLVVLMAGVLVWRNRRS